MVDELELPETSETTEPAEPLEPPPPINDRFLFVNVASMRAKQLRRGAVPRLGQPGPETPLPLKPERVAMEEVRQRLVHYDLPPPKSRTPAAEA
jgi:DNA-directed RNA polymerase subunit K/omega